MPINAKAGFFSSILGNEASAGIVDSISAINIIKNSQNMDLPQADPSSFVAIVEKNKNNKTNDNNIESSADVNIVSENALLPVINHIIIPGEIDAGDSYSDQISVYVVRKGDSISEIADMFDVSINTILWANDMKKGEKLKEGDTLIILPISGVKHTVLKGQTLKGIAKKYNVNVSDIASFNGIAPDSQLALGDELIIPDAEMIDTESPKPRTNSVNTTKTSLKTLIGYFINPVPEYKRKSQGLHGNNGVDLAAPTGTPIVAAASGTVLLARNGYNGGYGNMVIVKHPNSTQTLYAHMSKLGTHTGVEVSKGQVIGYVGSTGHSTGPHLHFEVHGAKNPAVDL